MCFLAQEKAGKEKASLSQQPLHPGRRGREQGDRGEDPQVVEANSSSSGTFSSEILMLGDCFTCKAYNSCIPGGHVSLSLPPFFPAIPEWLPFLIQKTFWHPVPRRSDQGRWTRAARAAVAASPSRAPGSAGPDRVFPSPRLPERS